MTHLIKVTNKNSFDITDYHDGLCYQFVSNEPINVPLEAMRHIFGVDFPADEDVLKSTAFRNEVFTTVARRWGWNSHDAEKIKSSRKQLDLIVFLPVVTKMVEMVADKSTMPVPRDQKPVNEARGKFKKRVDATDDESQEEDVA